MNTQRIERFRRALATEDIEGAVLCQPANVTYLTGFPAGGGRPSFVVIGPARTVLVVPGSAETARSTVSANTALLGYPVPGSTLDQVADVSRASAEALGEALSAAGLAGRRIGIEREHLSVLHAEVVARAGSPVALGDQVAAMRRIKDPAEIAAIRAAVRCNDIGFAAAARVIAPGVSEFAVLGAVVNAMQEASGIPIDLLDPTNAFISGPRTLLAAAPATSRRLEPGDLMIIDLNPFIGQYKGDTTRTFSIGAPTPEQQRAHDALVRGLEAAETFARPGVRACDVFAALLEPIADAGFGAGFRFHGGHALGLEHVERPYIIPGDDMPLEEGMVIALEPGVYLPGIGGLRIEENYVVTAKGLEALSSFPRELVHCG
jgi:Xaa-Pro aminopeptidase